MKSITFFGKYYAFAEIGLIGVLEIEVCTIRLEFVDWRDCRIIGRRFARLGPPPLSLRIGECPRAELITSRKPIILTGFPIFISMLEWSASLRNLGEFCKFFSEENGSSLFVWIVLSLNDSEPKYS